MIGSRCCRSVLALVLLLRSRDLAAAAASEVELSLLLPTGDLLGSRTEPSASTSPWHAVASGDPEHQSRLRFALSLEEPGFLPGVSSSATLRLESPRLNVGRAAPITVRDASSSIAVALQLTARSTLEVRAFPFDTDYWRIGYLHALDWGGTNVVARESAFLSQPGGAPGVLALLGLPQLRLFLGLKWADVPRLLDTDQRLWGALGGGRFELWREWRLELGLGYFQRPSSPALGAADLLEGASLRWVWHRGVGEPGLPLEPFRRASFQHEAFDFIAEDGEGSALAVEGVALALRQPLLNPALAPRLVPAPAAAFYGSTRRGPWQLHGALWWRSLRFVLRGERTALQAPTPEVLEHAELGAWLGGSFSFQPARLVPALELGVLLPAALEAASGLPGLTQTFIASREGLSALPAGAGRLPVVAARLSLRFQASSSVALLLSSDYHRDSNATELTSAGRAFADPNRLWLTLGAQARL